MMTSAAAPNPTARQPAPEAAAPRGGLSLPSLSIVVEWENARLSEAQRALRMLQALASQLDEAAAEGSREVEILVLHNPEAIQAEAVLGMIEHVRPRAAWPARVRLVASGERGYYEQKNFGVENTTGDLVLFVDSDVVPEPGWLHRLLASFDDPAVGVVCGSTYIELESFYDRAVALFWIFPLRAAGDELVEASSFYANNVAFKRSILRGNPFPDVPIFRGQCKLLAESLRGQGVRILRHHGARVSHPPPNGTRHFLTRAITHGYDEALKDRLNGRNAAKRGLKSFRDFGRRMRDSTTRIARGYRKVGLGRPGAVGAWGVALCYNACRLTGRLLTTVDPRIVRRYFPMS